MTVVMGEVPAATCNRYSFLHPTVSEVSGMLTASKAPFLSQQEVSVLQGLANGYQSKEIAHFVARSKPTVEATVRTLYAKLNARSRAQLVAKAIAFGIIDIPRQTT
jgi:DNA-binding NarL/FixJ family response regulator